jgi:hypothetical protein
MKIILNSSVGNRLLPKSVSLLGYELSLRLVALAGLFMIFLIPYSFEVNGDHVSGNYSFILFPVLMAVLGGRFQQPDKTIVNITIVYFLIFLVTSIYQTSSYAFFDRRLVSFIIFTSAFVLIPIKLDKEMITAFKIAVVGVSVHYSLSTLFLFLSLIGPDVGYEIKGVVGSQRYGFVLLLASWLTVMYKPKGRLEFLFKYAIVFILLNGLLLTFSRSSIAGVLGSVGLYYALWFFNWLRKPKNPNIGQLKTFGLNVVAGLIITYVSVRLIPMTFWFYFERILDLNITPLEQGFAPYQTYPNYDTYVYNVFESSEGFRLFMIGKIFDYLSTSPFFGAGYLGVWIMFTDLEGSAHNQLLDTLFRTGAVGFILYIYTLYRMLKVLFETCETGLFFGVIGILFVGLFHETFKLSQGAFIFAFLLSMAFQTSPAKSACS